MTIQKIKDCVGSHRVHSFALAFAFALGVFFCFALCGIAFQDLSDSFYSKDTDLVQCDWEACSDGQWIATSLPMDSGLKAGERMTIRTRLPAELPRDPAVVFKTYYQNISVSIDGLQVYKWDNSAKRPFGKASPPVVNLIGITPEDAGKLMTIEYKSPYDRVSGFIDTVSLGNKAEMMSSYNSRILPQVIACAVMIVMGFALFIITPFLPRRGGAITLFRYIGLFITMASLYLIVRIPQFQTFFINTNLRMNIGFISAMLLPLPMAIYGRYRATIRMKRCYDAAFWSFFFLMLLRIFLQMSDTLDFEETSNINRLMIALLLILLVYTHMDNIIRKENKYPLAEFAATLSLVAAGLCEAMFRNLPGKYALSGSCLTICILAFVTCIVVALTQEVISISKERARLASQVEQDRYMLMISQMQPHFLFNTMVAIQEMCYLEPRHAAEAIASFASYLRVNLDSLKVEGCVPFADELRHIENYMSIEQMRFGDKLHFVEELDTIDFQVPPLTIQPIVENAVQHGVGVAEVGGTVTLSTKKEDKVIILTVKDDGVGFNSNSRPERSMRVIRDRLHNAFGTEPVISSESGVGTVITITIKGDCSHENCDS